MPVKIKDLSKRFNSKFEDRNKPLEIRLWYYFAMAETIWALINGIAGIIFKLPPLTYWNFINTAIFITVYMTVCKLTKKPDLFRKIYLFLAIFSIPMTWFCVGGAKSSAGILFACELIIYIMCARGTEMYVYVTLSLISAGLVQRLGATPFFMELAAKNGLDFSPAQTQAESAVLGLSTTVMIALVLLRQKNEYMKERNLAVESEKQLEKSNSLQKNFLANMSHEIRSPLGIVMGFNNLIKNSEDLDEIHTYSKDISDAGTTLLTVINDILDYSKIESGKLDIIETDYSFSALINGISRDIELKCEEKGLKFVSKIDSRIPEYLYGDNIRIKQCLLNVLSNAVKYTDKGTVFFSVELKAQSEDSVYTIEYSVKDTGKGISKEAMPNIFSAFQRLDEGMNRGIEGTGLGMAITKNLLDEMHGTINVESELGVGSTFTIVLNQLIGENTLDDSGIDFKADLSGIKILAIDDTVLNLTLIRKLLEKEGASVTTLDNGKACLARVAEEKFDVILLDHMMPDMNGVEVFGRMKEQGGLNANTPVVMLTANAMAGAAQEYMEMGFDGYISKPISQKELKKTVIRLGRHY